MPYLRDRAIVLRKEPFREHDRRYTLYGREHGLLVAVARGSSSPLAKQAGHLEPFSMLEVMIARGKAFDKLAVAHAVPGGGISTLREKLAGLLIMGALCDLISALTRPGISDVRLFDILEETCCACATLPVEPSAERARLILAAATLKALDVGGFAPPLAEASESLPRESLSLLIFLRRAPVADVLRITAGYDIFAAASSFVEDACQRAPFLRPPHGPVTIRYTLSFNAQLTP